MKKAKDYRASAWKALTGRYWWAVLASLIASVLGGTASYNSAASSGTTITPQLTAKLNAGDLSSITNSIPPQLVAVGTAAVLSLVAVSLVLGIALLIVGGAVELGYDLFNIHLFTTSDGHSLSDLFSRFSIFCRALWLRILTGLKVFLWMLLFIIPGIIAAYRYALAPYILAEHPEMTAREAINESKRLMKGNKWRLFCLGFSFIGWDLLACLTAGIGFVFLAPYKKAAITSFYMDLTRNDPTKADEFHTTYVAGAETI